MCQRPPSTRQQSVLTHSFHGPSRPTPSLCILCLDKVYDDPEMRDLVAAQIYTAHARRGTERPKARLPGAPLGGGTSPRVAQPLRHLLIRWEKKQANYLALLHLACAWMTFRATEVFR